MHNNLPVHVDGEQVGFVKANPSLVNMFAQCGVHAQCVKSRTYSDKQSRHGGGVPVGFLCAWLEAAASFADKTSHMSYRPTFEDRRAARDRVKHLPFYNTLKGLEVPNQKGRVSQRRSQPDDLQD